MNHGIIRRNSNNKPLALVRLRRPLTGKFGIGFSYRGPFILVGIIDSKPRFIALPKPFFRTIFGHVIDEKGYHIETFDEMEYDMSMAMLRLPVVLL